MTREEAIKYIKSRCIGSDEERDGTQWSEAMWMAIEALRNCSEKPNGSLISRQDAIRWVKTECNPYGKPTLDFESGIRVIEHLEQMPSADRPTGKWIKSDILPNGWHCSHCDAPVMTDDIEEMLFCPHCGSYNGGEEE